jgi:hypothetical protein
VLVACLLLLCASFAALAEPAPGSLRVTKTADSIVLTWEAGTGPYGIYRSVFPDDIVRPAWLVGATADLTWSEPIAAAPDVAFYLVDEPQPCGSDSQCDNTLVCDGQETCGPDRICAPGTPVNCNDASACTRDECLEPTGECSYEPIDCDDGDPCTIDSCSVSAGCTYSVDPDAGVGTPAQLAGRSLADFPFFDFVRTFNEGSTVELGVDPFAWPSLVDQTCDVYVLDARSAQDWCAGEALVDVRGTPDVVTFVSEDIQSNTTPLGGSETLSADAGAAVGRGYDVALDCDRDGFLDPAELADGLADDAGFYLVHDFSAAGPLAVSQFDDIGPEPPYCGGDGLDDMRVYYPADLDDPQFTGAFPLVVISHGNGHCFDWYDFLGTHLASYGYIAMGHDNETRAGIEAASTTTLDFTDKIIREQATLGGGVLNGHIDTGRIAWIGHSRGGEGVVRAYDRLVDEGYPTEFYTAGDIVVISSIAPTDFLGPEESDPHAVPYHLLYGSADGDVSGRPDNPIAQSFGVFERAGGVRQSTYVHGADHNDFNCCGFNDFTGPADTEIGREEAQQVQKAIQLGLLEYYVKGRPAPADFFWRQWETLRPLGVSDETVVVAEARDPIAARRFTIDDYQTEPSLTTSSSGAPVDPNVDDPVEDLMSDVDGSFAWSESVPMNGMTRGREIDVSRGVVFEYDGGTAAWYELEIPPEHADFSDATYLALRATQGTRHPLTTAALEDLTFTVSLVDGAGASSAIAIGVYGGGVEEPYQRGGYGTGVGWQNEFESIRIRLTDFTRNGATLDLTNIRAVRFDFGPGFGSPEGRVALDNIELVTE